MNNEKVVHLQPARKPAKKVEFVEAVGAGDCVAFVERLRKGKDRGEYRWLAARHDPDSSRQFTCDFRAEDVLSLPKLAQVLAATLVADGWLEPGLKDDLRCLADNLDWFLNLRKPGTGYEWVAVRRESLEAVLNYVWDLEIEKFRNLSVEDRRQHVFRAAADLKGLLTGSDGPGNDLAGPESGAGMHV